MACSPLKATLASVLCAASSTVAISSTRTKAAVLGFDDHALELVDVLQIGIGRHVGDDEIALGLACGGLEVVGGDGGATSFGDTAASRHPHRVEPQRIAKVWPPRMSAEATPSTVDSTGCTTRVR